MGKGHATDRAQGLKQRGHSTMNTMLKKVVIAGIAMVGFVGVLVADYSPVANLTEKWTTDANWKLYGDGQRLFTGDACQIKFVAKNPDNPPLPECGALAADQSASQGRFVGNYKASQITDIEFDLKADGVPQNAVVILLAGGGASTWGQVVTIPAGTVGWVHVKLPLKVSAGWQTFGEGTQEAFDADLTDVTYVLVQAYRNGIAEQALVIDNFRVVGPWGGPLTQDGLPEYWLQEYALGAGEGHAAEDADKDGFSNFGEYMAGTDPNSAESFFKVEIVKREDGQAVLRWKHELNRKFSVLRAASLGGGFDTLKSDIQSAEVGNEFLLDEQDGGSYFYRIRIDQ
jgi:hypothetical protein